MPVAAPMRVTSEPWKPKAQTAPSPAASPPGRTPAWIEAVCAPEAGSTRAIVPPESDAAQIEPPVASAESRKPPPAGLETPTCVLLAIAPDAGSTRSSSPVPVRGTQTEPPSAAGTPAPAPTWIGVAVVSRG